MEKVLQIILRNRNYKAEKILLKLHFRILIVFINHILAI